VSKTSYLFQDEKPPNEKLQLYKLTSDGATYIKLYISVPQRRLGDRYMSNFRISDTAETPLEWISPLLFY